MWLCGPSLGFQHQLISEYPLATASLSYFSWSQTILGAVVLMVTKTKSECHRATFLKSNWPQQWCFEEENQTTTTRDCWAAEIWDSAGMDPDSCEKLQQSVSQSVPKASERVIKGSWWNTVGNTTLGQLSLSVLLLQILLLVLFDKYNEAGEWKHWK